MATTTKGAAKTASKALVTGDNIKALFLSKAKWSELLTSVKTTVERINKECQQLAENAVADMFLHGSTARFVMAVEAMQGRKGKPDGRASQRVQAFIAYVREVSGHQIAKFQELDDGSLSCKMKDGWDASKFNLELLTTPYYAWKKEVAPTELNIGAIQGRFDRLLQDIRDRGDKTVKERMPQVEEIFSKIKGDIGNLPNMKVEAKAEA